MTHLTDLEIVDLVENALDSSRARHVEGCEVCRDKADALRETLARTSDADVPEPSPLFWDHFSARVRDSVRDVVPERPSWFEWLHDSRGRWAASAAMVLVVVGATMLAVWQTGTRVTRGDDPSGVASLPAPTDTVVDLVDVESDQAWALVRAAADEVSWDDTMAAGVATRPGTMESAALALTREERSELVRLLQEETSIP